MNDQALYDQVAEEIAKDDFRPGLWARAFSEADGENDRARALYIKLRVQDLALEAERREEDKRKAEVATRERAQIYSDPKTLYDEAYRLHYAQDDFDAAEELYLDLIHAFPNEKESGWAQAQLEAIAMMTPEMKAGRRQMAGKQPEASVSRSPQPDRSIRAGVTQDIHSPKTTASRTDQDSQQEKTENPSEEEPQTPRQAIRVLLVMVALIIFGIVWFVGNIWQQEGLPEEYPLYALLQIALNFFGFLAILKARGFRLRWSLLSLLAPLLNINVYIALPMVFFVSRPGKAKRSASQMSDA